MSARSLQPLAWLVVLALLSGGAWLGWKALRDSPEPASGAGGPRGPSTVIVRPAESRAVVETVSATGTLRAVRRAEVASREAAAVQSLAVEEGDLVARGDLLARLDPRRLEAQIQEAEAALTASQAELTRREAERERAVRDEEMMRGLWDERAVAEREFLDSVRERKVAEAQEKAARDAIEVARKRRELLAVRRDDLEIVAPFDGRVVARHAELGEWLREGDPVVTLISTGEVEAWLQLPERHAALLRSTTPEAVELRVPGRSTPLQADRLTLIPDVDGRSRRFVLVARLPDPENELTPGLSVSARVPLGAPTTRVVVAADAILQGYDGNYVWVPQPTGEGAPISARVPVSVLFEENGEAILADGDLQVGDEVIVEGNERLFPATPLDPRPWSETRAGESAPPSDPEP